MKTLGQPRKQGFQQRRYFNRVPQHLSQRLRPFRQALRQRLAFDVLHPQEIRVVLMTDVVERANGRMIQTGNRARFAIKAFAQSGAIGKMIRQNLYGDDTVETRVAGFVYLAHPARTYRG